jgi:membrane protease YdiL (CAAX protease family)
MNETNGHFRIAAASPLYQLLISILTIAAIGFVLFVILFIAGTLIFGVELSSLSEDLLTNAGNADIVFFRYLMITEQICFFVIPGIYLLRQYKSTEGNFNSFFSKPLAREAWLVILLALCLVPVTGFTGELNSEMHFPEWLAGIEKWMIDRENEADGLFELISTADTFRVMLLNLFIISVLPALGEEMIFRGIFQRIFQKLFRNDHVGIWVIAFIFSAIHLQFFGFVPRFILGLVFGYLYYWSGTLWLPVLAHFVNNAVPTISVYLEGWEKANALPDTSLWIQLLILPAPLVIITMIMLYFRNKKICR